MMMLVIMPRPVAMTRTPSAQAEPVRRMEFPLWVV